jgi:hypothetical protein
LSCEYLREFSKKFNKALLGYSEDWGKLIHEKKPEVENLVTLGSPCVFHLLADCQLLVFETKDNELDKKERNKTFKEKTADPV